MRILSVPHDHPYVLRVTDTPAVRVLGDPSGRGDGRHVFDPAWFTAHAHRADLVHVHFGYERLLPGELRDWLDVVRDHGVPLVVSVHDLRNPHLHDNRRQEVLQDLLVPAADELITLTHAAAAEVGRRWGRTCTVLPHPHVASARWLAIAEHAARRRGPRRIGLHLKSLRTNFAPVEAVQALREVVDQREDVEVHVRHHNDVDTPLLRSMLRPLLDAADGRCRVTVSDYLPDAALYRWIESLDVLLLPYRFGTHSGWIELGKDLGAAVVAPDLPTYVEQGASAVFDVDDEQPTSDGISRAVREALQRPSRPFGVRARLDEAAAVVAGHERVYRRAAAQRDAVRQRPRSRSTHPAPILR